MKKDLKNEIKILITGTTGFVGANLVKKLINEGYKKIYTITLKNSNFWRIKNVLPEVKNFIADLREYEKLRQIVKEIQPDVIYHLAAASVYGGKSVSDKEMFEINLLGTINLVEACNDINYKCFVNTGSSSEYGQKEKSMKESDLCIPTNTYGISKYSANQYCHYIAKTKNKPIINFRLFSPFGPYDDPSRLITYAIINVLKENDIYLANPDAVRDYIYIEDVVNFYIDAIQKADKFNGETFNIGSGKEIKISYVIKKILELTNNKSKIFWNKIKPRSFDTLHWESDMNKSNCVFNRKITNFDEGLKKTVDWFKKNSILYEDIVK